MAFVTKKIKKGHSGDKLSDIILSCISLIFSFRRLPGQTGRRLFYDEKQAEVFIYWFRMMEGCGEHGQEQKNFIDKENG